MLLGTTLKLQNANKIRPIENIHNVIEIESTNEKHCTRKKINFDILQTVENKIINNPRGRPKTNI